LNNRRNFKLYFPKQDLRLLLVVKEKKYLHWTLVRKRS